MCIFRMIGVLSAGLLIACSSKPQPSNGASPNQPPVTSPAPAPDQPSETPPRDADDSAEAPDESNSGDGDSDKPMPAQGQPCPEGACAEGLTCISYYGIAGSKGPKFTSCERPCAANLQPCPEGQRCVVIADGPGQVCRAE